MWMQFMVSFAIFLLIFVVINLEHKNACLIEFYSILDSRFLGLTRILKAFVKSV